MLIVFTKQWHGRLSLDSTEGIQKFHSSPTPRIGGLAIFISACTGMLVAPDPVYSVLEPMLISALPVFVLGIAEDITKKIGITERLLAGLASGVLGWWLTGASLNRVDVWGLDILLTVAPFSVAFTAFAVAGIANAVNMIDGFNGLGCHCLRCWGSDIGEGVHHICRRSRRIFLAEFPLRENLHGRWRRLLSGFLCSVVSSFTCCAQFQRITLGWLGRLQLPCD
jgi:hypothetical protein